MQVPSRIILAVTLACGMTVVGCSGFGQGKKKDPAEEAADAALVRCDMPCCCKRIDDYYIRYTCTDAAGCAAKRGECLPGESRECAS